MRGAPKGNQNAHTGRIWNAAIQRALAKRSKGDMVKTLDKLAEKLLINCDDGDMQALKELGDRLDGKPAQAIDLEANVSGTMKLVQATPQDERI